MSSGASGYCRLPTCIDKQDLSDGQKDHPPSYDQVETLFEGFYDDDEAALIPQRNRPECSVSIEEITTYPVNQNLPQNPPIPAYLHQSRHDQQFPSDNNVPYQPDHEAYGPPPNYTELQNYDNAKFRSGPSAPHTMPATGQQIVYPVPTVNDPRPAVVTYPSSAAGQCIVSQSQVSGGQPRVFVVQPSLENPPSDYLVYSIFVTICCCWIIGVKAISTSRECRRAIAVGNRRLAEEKSVSARNTANASVVMGIFAYIVLGILLWFRISSRI